jgi:sugar-specific transcriptional regulator TrmB
MIDILALILGFGIGVIVVSIAIEFGIRKPTKQFPTSRRTYEWNIKEIAHPKIMAEYLGDIEIPANAKLLVNRYKDKNSMRGINVKQSSDILGNYILGDDRVLILAGPVKNEEMGFWTVEKDIVESLHREFDALWNDASQLSIDDK